MSEEPSNDSFASFLFGSISILVLGAFLWSLFADTSDLNDKRVAHKTFVTEFNDELQSYKNMLFIKAKVDAQCLSEGADAKGFIAKDSDYAFAQKAFEACFQHVLFPQTFRFSFYEIKERDVSQVELRANLYVQKLAAYKDRFKHIADVRNRLSTSGEGAKSVEEMVSPEDVIPLGYSLSDLEIFSVMKQMLADMEASCNQQKLFSSPGVSRPKMSSAKEIIWDQGCYESALYYHQAALPESWWKGISQLDLKAHYFKAKLTAYRAQFSGPADSG